MVTDPVKLTIIGGLLVVVGLVLLVLADGVAGRAVDDQADEHATEGDGSDGD